MKLIVLLLAIMLETTINPVLASCDLSECQDDLVACNQICINCPLGSGNNQCLQDCLTCLGQAWEPCCDCLDLCDRFQQLNQSNPTLFQQLVDRKNQQVKLLAQVQTLEVIGITTQAQENGGVPVDHHSVHQVSPGVFELDQPTSSQRKRDNHHLCTYGCWSCSQDCLQNGYQSWCCNGDRCCCSLDPPGRPCQQATRGACPNSQCQC